jgi:hypothetical protein
MSNQQRIDALQLANAKRRRQQQIRQGLTDRTGRVGDAITDPACERLLLTQVLQWQYQWSIGRAEKVCDVLWIPLTTRCGTLTDRKRLLLLDWIESGYRRRKQLEFEEQMLWESAA